MTPGEQRKLIERLAKRAKRLSQPIDFDTLVAKGVLKKEGVWYSVLDATGLPEHFFDLVRVAEEGPEGLRVKVDKPERYRNVAKSRQLKER